MPGEAKDGLQKKKMFLYFYFYFNLQDIFKRQLFAGRKTMNQSFYFFLKKHYFRLLLSTCLVINSFIGSTTTQVTIYSVASSSFLQYVWASTIINYFRKTKSLLFKLYLLHNIYKDIVKVLSTSFWSLSVKEDVKSDPCSSYFAI